MKTQSKAPDGKDLKAPASKFHVQYIVDDKGKRKAVIMPYGDYQRLLEDLCDLAVIAERRNEKPISWEEVKRQLKADGLLPD